MADATGPTLSVERFPPALRRQLRVLAAEMSTDTERVTMRDLVILGCLMVAADRPEVLKRIRVEYAAHNQANST